MTPFFSIILPTYNRAEMLRTALRSVLSQTCQDYECFVLDDGSTDETPAVFEEFRQEKSFSLIRFDDNRRQHVRRNDAIRRATGRFISFLDSDDIWLPRRLEIFKRAIEERPGTGFWFSNAYLLRGKKIIGTVFDPSRKLLEGAAPGWYAVGDEYIPYLTTNLAVRREIFNQVGFFREDMKILEDTELYARMLASGVLVGAIREPLSIRRLHWAQITMDHLTAYKECLMALEAGKIPPQEREIERVKLARKTAGYLLKSLRPTEARQFILTELGEAGRRLWVYPATFIPKPLLSWAKKTREFYLLTRGLFSGTDRQLKEVYRFLERVSKKD
jgi:glycosyltransferase involved in cell wall biosynthesis